MTASRYFTPAVLLVSAVYGVLAVGSFVLVLGPSGYEHNGHINLETWAIAAAAVVFVLVPYAVLFTAHKHATDSLSRLTTSLITALVASFGAYVYFYSFRPNDGEYLIAYLVIPLIQSPFAIGALAVSLRRERSNRLAT